MSPKCTEVSELLLLPSRLSIPLPLPSPPFVPFLIFSPLPPSLLLSLSSPSLLITAIHAREQANTKKLVGNVLALNLVTQLWKMGAIQPAKAPGAKKTATVVRGLNKASKCGRPCNQVFSKGMLFWSNMSSYLHFAIPVCMAVCMCVCVCVCAVCLCVCLHVSEMHVSL